MEGITNILLEFFFVVVVVQGNGVGRGVGRGVGGVVGVVFFPPLPLQLPFSCGMYQMVKG